MKFLYRFKRVFSTKLHEIPSNGSRADTCEQTRQAERRMDEKT